MNRLQRVTRVGYWMHAIVTWLAVILLIYVLIEVDFDDEGVYITAGILAHGVILAIFGNEVRLLRRNPEHRGTEMLDDLETANGSENSVVAGIRSWVLVLAILSLAALFLELFFSVFFCYQMAGYWKYMDNGDPEFFIGFGLAAIALFSGVSAVIYTVSNLRLKVIKPMELGEDLL